MVQIKERVAKLLDELGKLVYEHRYPIAQYEMRRMDGAGEAGGPESGNGWEIMLAQDIWGGHRERYSFRTVIETPEACAGRPLVYELRTGREGEWDALNPQFMAYVNGTVKQGLDVNHREILLAEEAKAGEVFEILLSAYTGDQNFSLHMDSEIKSLIPELETYYYDLLVPYEVARLLDGESAEYITIIQCLNESLNLLDLRKPYSQEFYDSLQVAQQYITQEFYRKQCGNSRQVVRCVGHTHIDLAWLWTLKTTEDKVIRSFATVLEYMRRYPEYKFMSSQPQLYQFVKKNAPELYEEIRERVAEGRWETEGGMFVEADCNLASGESLVRQFLHGITFFEKEFGAKNEILWLPDVFGYSAALPQIMKKCGIRYFMTTKISWNEFNKIPYDTFMWEGIDGTRVLTHFIPSRDFGVRAKEGSTETEHFTTYNGMLNPSQVKGSWQRYSQKDINNEVLMSYGYGDGGGGPTREMLEFQRRLAAGIPGCPRTVQSHALEFFRKLEEDVVDNKYLPSWVGELYLEYHRGTYTSMAENKRYNRKSEFAFTNLELYSVMAENLLGLEYPKERIRAGWDLILRNQFHDILPGSSIKEVYEDSRIEYAQVLAESGDMTGEALQNIADAVDGEPGDIVIFNPNSVSIASAVVAVVSADADGMAKDNLVLADGERAFLLQRTADGMVAVVSGVPAKGYRRYRVEVAVDGDVGGGADMSGGAETSMCSAVQGMTVTTSEVVTPYFHVLLDEKGQFKSIFDNMCGREIIPKGQKANVILTYEDKPHNFDAWDINHYYMEKSWLVDEVVSLEVVEDGPVRGCIRIERAYLESRIVQYLYFYRELYQIDIRNEIDWKEEQILVRDYFPVDVHANEAVYDIQYGNVKRPTHYNTSWDLARFEVCAHKWLDISEDGYGISVLNDCKYGCNVHDGVIGLTMLKSAVYPNPDADKGHHTFWYSICPHKGDYREGNTVAKAYAFNNPCRAVVKLAAGSKLADNLSFISADAENVVVEVVKQSEEGSDIIVRLYDCYNRRGCVTLRVPFLITKAVECNLLEREEIPVEHGDKFVVVEMKPYEIKTLKLGRHLVDM